MPTSPQHVQFRAISAQSGPNLDIAPRVVIHDTNSGRSRCGLGWFPTQTERARPASPRTRANPGPHGAGRCQDLWPRLAQSRQCSRTNIGRLRCGKERPAQPRIFFVPPALGGARSPPPLEGLATRLTLSLRGAPPAAPAGAEAPLVAAPAGEGAAPAVAVHAPAPGLLLVAFFGSSLPVLGGGGRDDTCPFPFQR